MAPPSAIILVAITAFLAAVGQLLIKAGSGSVSTNILSWVTNRNLILGVAMHAVGFVLLTLAFR